jgi:hypothetical protein
MDIPADANSTQGLTPTPMDVEPPTPRPPTPPRLELNRLGAIIEALKGEGATTKTRAKHAPLLREFEELAKKVDARFTKEEAATAAALGIHKAALKLHE